MGVLSKKIDNLNEKFDEVKQKEGEEEVGEVGEERVEREETKDLV